MGISPVLHFLHHVRDVGLGVGFLFPQIKFHIQIAVVLLEIGDRNIEDMIPQSQVSPVPVLQLVGGLHGFRLVCLILL